MTYLKRDKLEKTIDNEVNSLRTLKDKIKDREDRKICDEVFDTQTILALHKLIADGVISSIDYPVSTGKEANVFRGTRPDGTPVAIKIYRVGNATYKLFFKYIAGDPRFRNVGRNYRKLVYLWTQKEFKNLSRLRDAGVRVPNPIMYMHNILVMEYIGEGLSPAPRLKEVKTDDPNALFERIAAFIVLSYNEAHLVHADMSEYNILMQGGEPCLIDVSQAMVVDHPSSTEMMLRDVENIVKYFKRIGADADKSAILSKLKKPEKQRMSTNENREA